MTFNEGALPVSILWVVVSLFMFVRRESLTKASDRFWGVKSHGPGYARRVSIFTGVMCGLVWIGAVLILVLPLWD